MTHFRLSCTALCLIILTGCLHFESPEPETVPEDKPVEIATTPTSIPTATYTPMLSFEPEPTVTPIPSATPAPQTTDENVSDTQMIQLNFEDASLREILEYLAELANWDYLISPEVGSGSVTLRTSEPFKSSDIEKVLYSLLDVNNLAVVEGPRGTDGRSLFKKIIPKPDAKHSPITMQQNRDLDSIPREDRVVTQIITTKYVSPDEILSSIQPLISPDANIITHPGSGMMIVTDTLSNIRRVLQIVNLLDQETALLELEIFQIEYADVEDIVSVLDRVLSARVSLGGMTTTPSRNTRTRQPPTRRAQGASDLDTIMIPDTRSNSLIVFALRKDLDFIREIISMLDVDIYVTKKAYIYYVENAKAIDLANLLEAVYSGSNDQGRSTRRTTRVPQTRSGVTSAANAIGGADIQGEVSIVADERTNSLIVVTAPVNYPHIEKTIKQLDTMPKQVLIEVLIADVTLDESTEMGISWNLRSEGSMDIGGETYYFDGTANQTIGGPESGFVYDLYEASRFKAILSAKANENKLEILSNPTIYVSNNMEASIDVGSDIPIVTSVSDEGVDASGTRVYDRTIEYRSTGILLNVIPHINSANFVNLEISQEVSNISETSLEGINSPVIETRKASTSVMVKDNQTLVIGGLIQRTKNPSREGVPWFYRVPILKYLFGTHKYTERVSELLIFLTPHVIESSEESQYWSDKVKDKSSIDTEFYQEFVGLGTEKPEGENQ